MKRKKREQATAARRVEAKVDLASLPLGRSRRYDIGVLLVHGIGQQRRSETVVEAGVVLVGSLQATLRHGAGETPGKESEMATVRTGSVHLQRHEDRGPGQGRAPA